MEEVIGLIFALSIASERLVEVIKGLVPYLKEKKTDEAEQLRQVLVQGLAVVSGIAITFMMQAVISEVLPNWDNYASLIVIGLLASGGSSIWNTAMSFLSHIKEIKKSAVTQIRQQASSADTPPSMNFQIVKDDDIAA